MAGDSSQGRKSLSPNLLDSTSAFSSEQASSQASPCSTSVSVYFIRHAHSAINSPGAPVNVFDPPLSAKGRDQARNIAKAADWLDPGLVLCSPLQRAMETAAIAFENYMDPCTADFVPIIACDSLREVFGGTDRVAEHRRSRSALQQLFPMIDCTELSEEDELLLAFARCNGREHSADLTSRGTGLFQAQPPSEPLGRGRCDGALRVRATPHKSCCCCALPHHCCSGSGSDFVALCM